MSTFDPLALYDAAAQEPLLETLQGYAITVNTTEGEYHAEANTWDTVDDAVVIYAETEGNQRLVRIIPTRFVTQVRCLVDVEPEADESPSD